MIQLVQLSTWPVYQMLSGSVENEHTCVSITNSYLNKAANVAKYSLLVSES